MLMIWGLVLIPLKLRSVKVGMLPGLKTDPQLWAESDIPWSEPGGGSVSSFRWEEDPLSQHPAGPSRELSPHSFTVCKKTMVPFSE